MIALTRQLASRVRRRSGAGLLGIDIGTHSIKLAQVRRCGAAFRIHSAQVVPHRHPLQTENRDAALAQIIETIELIAKPRGRWFSLDAACVLPMSAMEFRSMKVPPGSLSEQQGMIRQELADETATSADDWSIAHWPDLTGDDGDGVQSVSVLGVNLGFANRVLDALLRCGLSCGIMSGHPHLQARALNLIGESSAHESVAVVDWGYTSTVLTLVAQGVPVYSRVLRDCGFRGLLDAVGSSFDLKRGTLEPLMCGTAAPTSPLSRQLSEMLLDNAAAPLQRLREELRRTLSFLRQKHGTLQPRRLVLCGGGSTLRGVESLFLEATSLPASIWQGEFARPEQLKTRAPLSLLSTAASLSTLRWAS